MTKRTLRNVAIAAAFIVGMLALPAAASAAPPPNDNFASAQVIGPALPISVTGSSTEATAQGGEPNVSGNAPISTVWYRWTAPGAGVTVVNLCEAGFTGPPGAFAVFEVYTGATLGTLVSQAEGNVNDCLVRFTAAAGQEYRIQLDYRGADGDFTLKLRQLAPPANNNFASATVIPPALPASLPATNVDSGWQANEPPALGGSSDSRSVWFNWTAPANGQVRASACDFDTISGPGNLALIVYTGAAINALTQVPNTAVGNCEQTFTAVGGTTYRIAFSGAFGGEGNFTLGLKNAPPPVNDNFGAATVLSPTLPVSTQADNEFAGPTEVGEPGHGGLTAHRSVWYEWTPTENARVVVRACSKDFTARVGVYTGVAVNTLTTQGDEPGFAPYCQLPLDAVAGTTYRIAVGGGSQDGEYGKTTLQIRRQQVPANDDFTKARNLLLKGDGQITGTTVDASTEQSEPGHEAGSYTGSGVSVWYRWTAQSSQPVILSACSKTEPVILAVYTGSEVGSLTQVAASNNGCPSGSQGGRLALAPTKGTTYRIAVASKERDFDAAFTLSSKGPYATQPKYNLKKQLKSCKKVKSKKKRVRCQKSAKEKNAVLNCQKKLDSAQQSQCVKAAREKY